jgi:transposase
MTKALSEDLRSRVIAAVDGGLSRCAAAERFEVSVATAIRWMRAFHTTGARSARARGGDQRSGHTEAYRHTVLDAIKAQVDVTLAELSDLLRRDLGACFAPRTLGRFLDRHPITFKKGPTLRSKTGPTSRPGHALGSVLSAFAPGVPGLAIWVRR